MTDLIYKPPAEKILKKDGIMQYIEKISNKGGSVTSIDFLLGSVQQIASNANMISEFRNAIKWNAKEQQRPKRTSITLENVSFCGDGVNVSMECSKNLF